MDQAIALVATIDFDMVKKKLMDPETGEGWSQDHCDRVCAEYRRFLALRREYPMFAALVPSSPVDTFWHYHILDTQKYAADCESIFGSFLHHYPYYGMRDGKDLVDLENSWINTRNTYERHFGDPPDDLWQLPVRCG